MSYTCPNTLNMSGWPKQLMDTKNSMMTSDSMAGGCQDYMDAVRSLDTMAY